MSTRTLIDAAGHAKHEKGTGAGTEADPFIPEVNGAVADGGNVAIGTTTDAPFVGAEDGTARTGISLWKGIKNALGWTTGAAVITDASGTIQQYLRGLVVLWLAGLKAGEAHIGEVGGKSDLIDLTFSLDTSAYASGDVIAEVQALTNAARVSGGTAVLQDLVLTDEDDQGVAMTLFFFDSSVTLGNENGAPSISDADDRKALGWVDVATTDWKDLGGVRQAHLKNLGIVIKPASGRDIYVGIVNGTGTPTFTASGMRGRFKFLQD
jgi:hypothetical protein